MSSELKERLSAAAGESRAQVDRLATSVNQKVNSMGEKIKEVSERTVQKQLEADEKLNAVNVSAYVQGMKAFSNGNKTALRTYIVNHIISHRVCILY